MAVKIRLQRHGKKNFAFFHIVVADTRSPRDGRYIEQIGSYNPNTNPATIVLDSERALAWLKVGAEPSLVCRRILSYEGVLLRNHLDGGIAKGALTENDAQRKFDAWKQEKESKISNVKREEADKTRNEMKKRLEAETKVREAISAKVAAKQAAAAEAEAAAAAEKAEEEAANAEATEAPAEATENPAE